jgi:hypothetical protein
MSETKGSDVANGLSKKARERPKSLGENGYEATLRMLSVLGTRDPWGIYRHKPPGELGGSIGPLTHKR